MSLKDPQFRIKIAEETVKISEIGQYHNTEGIEIDFRKAMSNCIENTVLLEPDFLQQLLLKNYAGRSASTKITLTGETTLEAAKRLAVNGRKVLALNFASARNVGGGFLKGSLAQEESIARSSGLYLSLLKAPDYYERHRKNSSLLYSDTMIYSPEVPVFRTDEGTLLHEPYLLSVLTSPAANKGAILQNNAPGIEKIEEVMDIRTAKVLAFAAEKNYRVLVLGAWGCGVFGNDPLLIASLFKKHICDNPALANAFEEIVFAVYDTSKTQEVRTAFENVFHNVSC
ncbi:MAG: TIGR02452 family protein [Bacteroidia bacterium]|jgi:uncharacterized protein (TIGR02452 family)|nr:TIGR02452 family protein [Bacteroidia bacterium]